MSECNKHELSEEEMKTLIQSSVNEYPDFPKEGVLFRDIFGALAQPAAFAALHRLLLLTVDRLPARPHVVVALDARGFLFAPLVALHLGVPLVGVRKRGKLPGTVMSVNYDTEYSQETLELQQGSVGEGQHVVVVDDLLATGGSLLAACQLVERAGAEVTTCLTVIELAQLSGRSRLAPRAVHSLVVY